MRWVWHSRSSPISGILLTRFVAILGEEIGKVHHIIIDPGRIRTGSWLGRCDTGQPQGARYIPVTCNTVTAAYGYLFFCYLTAVTVECWVYEVPLQLQVGVLSCLGGWCLKHINQGLVALIALSVVGSEKSLGWHDPRCSLTVPAEQTIPGNKSVCCFLGDVLRTLGSFRRTTLDLVRQRRYFLSR